MAIVGSSFVLPLLLQIIHIKGTYELHNECLNTTRIEPLGGFFDTPPAVFWAAAIGIMLSLFLARFWIAKKE